MRSKKGGTKSHVERKRDEKIEKIANYRNFLKGSVVETLTRCGNPNCHCAKGQRHHVLHLSYKEGKKTKRVYLPRQQDKMVRKWIRNRKEILELLKKAFELNLRLLKEQRK